MVKFISDRQYYGDIFIIDGKKLSTYARKKLQLTNDWGFVNVVEEMTYGKVKVDVYYFDFCGCVHVNYVSTEIVEKCDIIKLDWYMVMYLYNTQGMSNVIQNYLHYLEIYNVSSFDVLESYKGLGVYNFPDCFDKDKCIGVYDSGDYFQDKLDITTWMIEQVENSKVNIDKQIENLNKKYRIKS